MHLGWHLARRGYVAICPRCSLWQDGGKTRLTDAVAVLARRHSSVKGMAKMLFDASRAVNLLVCLADVDPKRIGAISHSLGAKEVLYLFKKPLDLVSTGDTILVDRFSRQCWLAEAHHENSRRREALVGI